MSAPAERDVPLVSVITISRHDLDGLRATLPSVSAQTYPRIEHIVLDAGSGPDVESYLESREGLHYWHSRIDRGRYDAMNQGAALANGDVLWWLHSGDAFTSPSAVGDMIGLLTDRGRRSARERWGFGRVDRRDSAGRSLGVWGHIPFEHAKFSWGIRPIPHQATAVGADLFARSGPYDDDFGLAADHLLMARLACAQRPDTTSGVLVDFDVTGAGSVRSVAEHHADIRRAWDELGTYPLGSRAWSRVASHALSLSVSARVQAKRILIGGVR
ncbi:glycosyltransferase [Rhodococcus sp. BP-349]|uniref:glycosyltransferase n=1 Tax=unclassified Rhodococcus (in: high G+C Gram-positive bacteria) TaxID=192944 RepID=UPI001C9A45FD|nr:MULTISPECIES: glycosyltransferase [unclassified Rhodococcus (in: high G+C Gram-positive bacteria)]MBY6539479.1 glycosyltransferase [Rhodococcus sp. BP-363]MBY6544193.1 glycosyltransferase [Rhodococcus sp. BP-369]MBY6563423.1 glycosyltransferase [Rhodococcus sp. BP-370]MBY6577715.1 glycosyltransferase [Rhodococcus sp. BP-364]MBY6587016.1 glycosyltransferase [Rhodococcus sp. BP-358]